jgi:PEP-CTERM motif
MHSGTRIPRVTFVLLASCLWLSGAGLASAAPITYDEAISGDLSGQNIGTFDIGANTVTGAHQFFGGLFTLDSFQFVVAAGQQLDSIVVTSFDGFAGFTLAPPGPVDLTSRYGIVSVFSSSLGSDILPALLLSDPGKTATAPLPAEAYQVLHVSRGGDYTYTFNVSAAPEMPTVPEPATLTLTGLGMLGAAFLRRRAARA